MTIYQASSIFDKFSFGKRAQDCKSKMEKRICQAGLLRKIAWKILECFLNLLGNIIMLQQKYKLTFMRRLFLQILQF